MTSGKRVLLSSVIVSVIITVVAREAVKQRTVMSVEGVPESIDGMLNQEISSRLFAFNAVDGLKM